MQADAQVVIRGTVKNERGEYLTNYILKVKYKNKAALIFFDPAVTNAQFDLKLQKLLNNDTLELIIEKMSYQNLVKEIILTKLPFETDIEIVLPLKPKELQEIIIKPSVWRRGDTTIYTVDSFITGEERKLKDILTKLPGFAIDDEGKLKFKNKEVAKILVEGEDLFGDKVGLLLESFPAHVIAEVQAVENDPKNKLLAGISLENETIINLKLKKQKTVFFGDMEFVGATNQRYAVNPTLFSVSRKTKWALVGFHNNMGTQLSTVFPIINTKATPPGLQLNSIYQINNFSPSRFLVNNLLSEQVVFNYSLFKKAKMKTEIAYGQEKLNQFVKQESSFLDNVVYFNRNDSLSNGYKNKRLKLKQHFEWIKANKMSLIAQFSFQQNSVEGLSSNYIKQSNFADTVENQGKDKGLLFFGEVQFTKRFDSIRALTISLTSTNLCTDQNTNTSSGNVGLIFSQSSSTFNLAKLFLTTNVSEHQMLVDWITKKGKRISSQQFLFSNGNMGLSNSFRIGKTTDVNSNEIIPRFSNTGNYSDYNIGYQSRLNIRKEKSISNLSWYGGVSYIDRNDKGFAREAKLLPVVVVRISHTFLTKGKSAFPIVLEFSNKAIPLDQLTRGENVVQFNTFQQFRFSLRSLPVLNSSIAYTKTSLSGKNLYLVLRGSRDFVSPVFTNRFDLFYNFTTKEFVNLPTNRVGLYASHNFPIAAIRAVLDLHVSVDYWEQYLSNTSNTGNVKNGNFFSSAGASLKFSSFSKLSITAESSINFNKVLFTNGINITTNNEAAVNLKSGLMVRYFLSRNSSAGFKLNSYGFDLLNRKQLLLFSDIDYMWRAPKGKFELQLRGENIFDQKNYVLTAVTLLSQSRTEVPLIGRNLQLSVKFNL